MKVEYEGKDFSAIKYHSEIFKSEIFDEKLGSEQEETYDNILEAIAKAKELASKGKEVEIWELKYKYKP